MVGAIYELNINEKSQISGYDKARTIGYWEDEDNLTIWHATHKAIMDSEANVKVLKKKEEDYCKVLRDCYKTLPYTARAAFIARVVKMIIE